MWVLQMYLLGWNVLGGHTQCLGSAHHPWLSHAGQVLCLHSRGGHCPSLGRLVMTQGNSGSTNPGAALFPGRCFFPHYTFLGFFYTLIQADPGCVVSLCPLGSVCEDKELGIETEGSLVLHWRTGSFPGGHDNVTGVNASWWQLLHGSFPALQGERRKRNAYSTSIHQNLFSTPDLLFAYLSEKKQNSSAYLETSGGLPATACYTNTSNYDVPCSKMTSFPKCSLYLASHSSKMHLCPNTSLSVSQTSAAVVLSISPVLLAWKLEILQIYNKLSKVFIINGGNHIWTEQFIPVLTPLNYTWDKFELLFIVDVLATQHSNWDCVRGSRWKRSMSSFCPLTVSHIVHRWMSLLEINSEADDFVFIELNKSNNLFSLLRRFILAYLETEN